MRSTLAVLRFSPPGAVFLLKCGHTAPAPTPHPSYGDMELHPTVVCPTCGRPDPSPAYDGTGAGA